MVRDLKMKQPVEVLDYDVTFEDWLPEGDALSSAVVNVDIEGLTVDSHEVIGTLVKVWLSGGTDGSSYKVTVIATTNDGRIKEAEFKIRVREL